MVGAVQLFYLISYTQTLSTLAFEILVAVRWPLFHRVHFTPRRTMSMIGVLLGIDVLLSCLHFVYGFSSALVYEQEAFTVTTNEFTREGRVFSRVLLLLTSGPCATVLVWSTLTVITLRSTLRVPRTLSNGTIQRDPVTGATRITSSHSQGSRKFPSATEAPGTARPIWNNNTIISIRNQATSAGKAIPNLSLRGTRQYSHLNLLAILFAIRFSLVWFGSMLVSWLIVLFFKKTNKFLANDSEFWYTSMNSTLTNDSMIFNSNYTTTLLSESSLTRKIFLEQIRRLKSIKLNIVFYCLYLIGIEDIFFYIAYNKRFRKANIHCVRKLCTILCNKL